MFTFGRKTEIDVVLRRHGGEEKATFLIDVVNSIHDLLEGKAELADVLSFIEKAIIEGRRDIWDAAGTWLLKMYKSFPESGKLWLKLANHSKAEVRYRVAAHIIDLPEDLRTEIYLQLKNDSSKKVRELAEGKWDFCVHPENYT